MDYTDLLKYPEFDSDLITVKYTVDGGNNEAGEPMLVYPDFVFDTEIAFKYLILVYAPDSDLASIKDLKERKELAFKKAKVPRQFHAKIIANENHMIGDMLTRFFREYEDFDYELLISAKEAVITLLEVVRKPVDSQLLDDKERNAIKSKRECFDDSKYLMGEIKKIMNELNGKSPDAGEVINQSAFKGGMAERFANEKK